MLFCQSQAANSCTAIVGKLGSFDASCSLIDTRFMPIATDAYGLFLTRYVGWRRLELSAHLLTWGFHLLISSKNARQLQSTSTSFLLPAASVEGRGHVSFYRPP